MKRKWKNGSAMQICQMISDENLWRKVKDNALTIPITKKDGSAGSFYCIFISIEGKLCELRHVDFQKDEAQYLVLEYHELPRYPKGSDRKVYRRNGIVYDFLRLGATAWEVPNPFSKPIARSLSKDPEIVDWRFIEWVDQKDLRAEQRKAGKLNKKHDCFARYFDSLGGVVDKEGRFQKMSFDEYIEWLRDRKGNTVANRVKRRKEDYILQRYERYKSEQ